MPLQDGVGGLNDVEKLLLYLQLPTGVSTLQSSPVRWETCLFMCINHKNLHEELYFNFIVPTVICTDFHRLHIYTVKPLISMVIGKAK